MLQLRDREAVRQHHAAEAGKAARAGGGEHDVRVGAGAVEGEKVGHAQRIAVVLLAEHCAVHAEDAYVAVCERVAVDVDHTLVVNVRLHGVALNAHGEVRAARHALVRGDIGKVLVEHRRGIARGGGGIVERDQARLALAAALLCQLVAVVAKCVGHAAHGAAPDGRERAVFFQQRALGPGEIEAAAAVAAAEELVGVSAQRVEQPQQHVLLGEADAGLIVADGAGGNAELLGQRRARQAAGLAARLELIAEAHGKHLL